MKGKFENDSAFTQLSILALILFCCSQVAIFFSSSIFTLFSGILSESSNLRLMLFLQNCLIFIASPFIAQYFFWNSNPVITFQLQSPPIHTLLLGCLAILSSSPFIDLLSTWNQGIHLPTALHQLEEWMIENEKKTELLTAQLLNATSWSDMAENLIVTALLAGIGEELLFRGVLQKIFIQWTRNIHIGICITACLFSAIHMQFSGFIPRFVLGALLGYLYIGSRNLWIPIAAHSLNNACVIIFTPNELTRDSKIITAIAQTENNYWLIAGSFILTAICLFQIWKSYRSSSSS